MNANTNDATTAPAHSFNVNEEDVMALLEAATSDVEETVSIGDTATVEAKAKRFRTSPRQKCFDEVLAMFDAYTADLKKTVDEDSDAEVALEVANDLRCRVVALSDGSATAAKPSVSSAHYLGKLGDGSLVHFKSSSTPSVRTHGVDSKHNFVSCLGPMRTFEAATYSIAHPDTPRPIVF